MKYTIHKTQNYTVICNSIFRETEMTLKAKGLFAIMMSLPDDWKYSIEGLCTLSKDGKDSVMAGLEELEKFGYLIRTRVVGADGRFAGYDYDLYEEPQKSAEKPFTEKPYAENPNTENPPQQNTKEQNNKELNTKEPRKRNTQEKEAVAKIVGYLNEKTGSHFRPNNAITIKHIGARMAEGFTVEDFFKVIDIKCAKWLNDEKMKDYLRPVTLFGTKFEAYLNENPNGRNGRTEGMVERIEEMEKLFDI